MTTLFRRIGSAIGDAFAPVRRWFYWMYTIQNRERKQLLEEATQMRELMPLLMKQRNGYRWTKDDRTRIRVQLRRLSRMSPYLIPLLMPGGFLVLPILSWWMDRRRLKRAAETKVERSSVE
jgi:hypothetical protein